MNNEVSSHTGGRKCLKSVQTKRNNYGEDFNAKEGESCSGNVAGSSGLGERNA